jgi:hypothetical protein
MRTRMSSRASLLFGFAAASGLWLACAGGNEADRAGFGACSPGEERPCTCASGAAGAERCTDGNEWPGCACATLTGAPDAQATSKVCGDGICGGGEDCRTCTEDCGVCPKCSLAPSCTDAVGVPSSPKLRSDLSQPPPDGGAPAPPATGGETCKDPELRMRIESIQAHDGGGELYCVVSATDGATSEATVTAKTKSLKNGETHFFDVTTGIYWGQGGLHKTTNNLTVTLNCFVVKSDAWSKVLGAMGDTAKDLGGTATPYGWAFGLGGVAANAAAAAIAAGAGDELRFNAQQTVDKKELLDLTNGRTWTLRKTGDCGVFCDWDWEVKVQTWGCADAISTPAK